MAHWGLQYGKYVEILEPESLREEIASAAQTILHKYTT
jgi:predicted DNA-binding transcriptional regulator YafY